MHGHEEGLNHIEKQAFVRDKLEKSTKSSKMLPKLYTQRTNGARSCSHQDGTAAF